MNEEKPPLPADQFFYWVRLLVMLRLAGGTIDRQKANETLDACNELEDCRHA